MVIRDVKKLGSVAGNNFFLFAFLALSQSGAFLQIVLGMLLLFPLSTDPVRNIPPDRLQLWPLSRRNRALLRMASFWFSPAAWIALVLLVRASTPWFALEFLVVVLLFYAATTLFSSIPSRAPAFNLLRYMPGSGLVRKNLRELLSLLDPYIGLVLSIAATAYRIFSAQVEPDALLMVSLLIVLALSTHALTLFGLDTASGFTRYRLLPLRGWQILAAKDTAFFTVLLVLVLPLAPLPAIAAGLMAVSVGHSASIKYLAPQTRWRFTGGASLGAGLLQVFLMFSAGTMVARSSKLVLIPCLLIYVGSLLYFGKIFEQVPD